MGALSDEYDRQDSYLRHKIPANFTPYRTYTLDEGEIQSEPFLRRLEDDDLLRAHGLDPDVFMIVGDVRIGSWQQSKRLEDGDRDTITLYSHRFRYTRRVEKMDLPALFATARKLKYRPPVALHGGKGVVVVWADPQTGKVGSRGGTEELIARVTEKQQKLAAYLKHERPDACLFADAGDGVENFENVPGQMFTNDLSLMDQVDLEATFEFDTIALMSKYAPTTVAKVPSNHGAWRRGKGLLGRPADDWGIHIGKRLQHEFKVAGVPIEFVYPHPEDASMAVDFMGSVIGLTHGHLVSRPEGMPDWWARQVHGAQAVAHADILVTGHFHHLRLLPTGRNPYTGRSKWWIQAPTLDNGSDWYRNLRGDDSDPGLLVFQVNEYGFDLSSLTVL